jgi:hypothetical protein
VPINDGLANLSHYSFVATVVAYALAVLAFACDFAFGRDTLGPLRSARKPAADLVAVGAAPSSPGSGTSEPGSTPSVPAAGPGTGQDARGWGAGCGWRSG